MTVSTADERTVLVVDDEAEIRDLLSMALRRASFVPVTAMNGDEALEIIETVRPAVVVLDMSMPGLSGIEVIRALRARPGTATLPILMMTGSGDRDTVLHALASGADDFLAKPVRLDELVARLEAHMRTRQAWAEQLEAELRARADAVGAIGRLTLPSERHEAAAALVQELGRATGSAFVAIVHLVSPGRFEVLATFEPARGVGSGDALSPRQARYLMARAREGPWVEDAGSPDARRWMPDEWPRDLGVAATAPIRAGSRIVGVLVIAAGDPADPLLSPPSRPLAEVIDYANIVSAAAGADLDRHGRTAGTRARLGRILSAQAFYPEFQPIVDLRDGGTVGFEALTRFTDGAAPDIRFAEASTHDLGLEFEAATLEAAIAESRHLPSAAWLSLNVSPAFVLDTPRLVSALAGSTRPVILELTEHVPIDDYAALRDAFVALGPRVRLAVDDAGAGYASLRHILELRPSFVKLDLTIVRGIEDDPLRQGLVAGLVYFARRTRSQLIAEGIETEAEGAALQELGIWLGQGYLLGRPDRLG